MSAPQDRLRSDVRAAELEAVARGVLARRAELTRVRELLKSWAPMDVDRLRSILDAPADAQQFRELLRGGLPADAIYIADVLQRHEVKPEMLSAAVAVEQLAADVLALTRDQAARVELSGPRVR